MTALALLALGACVNQGHYTPAAEYPATPDAQQAKRICDHDVYSSMTHIPLVDIARLGELGAVFDRCMMEHGWVRS